MFLVAGRALWRQKLKKLSVAVLAVLLAACAATIPIAPKTVDEAAKTFTTPPDQSVIYIARESEYFGKAILFQVVVDGKLLGGIARGTYYMAHIPPGEHSVTALSNENQDSLKLKMEAGKVYYVKVNPRWGAVSARVSLQQLSDEEGRELVKSSMLAAGLNP